MNPQILSKIFAKCAAFWSISNAEVEEEYTRSLFTITETAPKTYKIDHQTRPDLVVIIEDES